MSEKNKNTETHLKTIALLNPTVCVVSYSIDWVPQLITFSS